MYTHQSNLGASIALAFVAVLLMNATQAGNLGFLKDAPMSKFNDADVKLLTDNANAALAEAKTRIVHAWTNPDTAHSGTAEALLEFPGPNGIACKRLRISNRAGSVTSKATYTLCDMEGTGWTLVPSDYAPVPKAQAAK